MDQHYNLTSPDEFRTGIRVRFVSYLDPDVVLGVDDRTEPPRNPFDYDYDDQFAPFFGQMAVRRLTGSATDVTDFPIIDNGNGTFAICFSQQAGWMGTWIDYGDVHDPLVAFTDPAGITPPRTPDCYQFTVDFVNGPWLALNNHDHTRVVDINDSKTDSYSGITAWRWNGGANQIFRAQIVDLIQPG